MSKNILDESLTNRKGRGKSQESYWLLLIGLFIWFITSLTVGITGYLPWSFSVERMLSILLCLIIQAVSILGYIKARESKRLQEINSREKRFGYIGNIILLIVFSIINLNNIMDIFIWLQSE